jgi:hypothetical protein
MTENPAMTDGPMFPGRTCISCGKLNDQATDPLEEVQPKPGDVSICFYCGHIAVFTLDLTLREPNLEEARDIAGNPEILSYQRARAAAMAEWKK